MDFTVFWHEPNVFYICSQVAALVGTVFSLLSIQQRSKKRILDFTVIAALFGVLHYGFLAAWSGALTKVVSASRSAVADYETRKNKNYKIIPFLFVLLYIIVGFPTFISPISVFPILAASFYTVAIYFGNAAQIRYCAALSSILWLIYDFYVFSLVGIITETIFILNDILAIYRFHNSGDQKLRKTSKLTKSSKSARTRSSKSTQKH